MKADQTNRFSRRAEWVWTRPPAELTAVFEPGDDPASDADRNRYVHFRRSFSMVGAPKSARVFVSAGGRYKLFVNAQLVGRGPGRCHPEFQYVDQYDLTSYLKPGENVIACLVHSYGADMPWYVRPPLLEREIFGCGGFFFQGLVDADPSISLDTGDGGWRCLVSEAWNPDTRIAGPGFEEDFSFERESRDWLERRCNLNDWRRPIVQRATFPLGETILRPFPRMIVSGARKLVDGEPVRPASVRVASVPRADQDLSGFRTEGASVTADDWTQPDADTNRLIRDAAAESVVVYMLDFGQTQMGRFFLEVDALAGAEARFSYSERIAPNGSALIPDPVPGISEPSIHRVRFREGKQRFEQFEPAGFRYVEVHIDTGEGVHLTDYGVVPSLYPTAETGRFTCSDTDLEEVWNGSVLTARLCRQDGFIDCPHREQRQWTGDAYIQALLGYMVHADPGPAERMLHQIAETQRPDGMVMMATVSDLSAAGKIFIPDFSLWWVLAMETHLLYTGRTELLTQLVPAALRLLNWFMDFVDDDGLLSDLPGWTFIDWSMELDRRGQVTVLNALFARALRAIRRVAMAVGLGVLTDGFGQMADSVATAVNHHLYDERRGLYADSRHDGVLSEKFSQHANCVVVAFDIAPTDKHAQITESISDPSAVTLTRAWSFDVERPFAPDSQIILAQPFFSHFVHEAYARTGRVEPMLAALRDRWLPMIRRNGTIWEHWQDTPTTSLCHAFSATPLYDLPTHVVGISPTEPGFARFVVRPQLGDLEWVEAAMPTPHGDVVARWEVLDHGDLRLALTVPQGTAAVIELPPGFTGATEFGPGKHELTYHAG